MKAAAGLMVFPRTKEDLRIINKELEGSDFYAEFNTEFGFLYFPEEEDCYDDLEMQLGELFGTKASYRVEGIF